MVKEQKILQSEVQCGYILRNPATQRSKSRHESRIIEQRRSIVRIRRIHSRRKVEDSLLVHQVVQPYDKTYGQAPQLKPEFREKWSDIVNQVLRLRPCLRPRKCFDQIPQGGYTPLIGQYLSEGVYQ